MHTCTIIMSMVPMWIKSHHTITHVTFLKKVKTKKILLHFLLYSLNIQNLKSLNIFSPHIHFFSCDSMLFIVRLNIHVPLKSYLSSLSWNNPWIMSGSCLLFTLYVISAILMFIRSWNLSAFGLTNSGLVGGLLAALFTILMALFCRMNIGSVFLSYVCPHFHTVSNTLQYKGTVHTVHKDISSSEPAANNLLVTGSISCLVDTDLRRAWLMSSCPKAPMALLLSKDGTHW